ncbi:YggS family pyridoxal phosphate-dependent enzyme [Anaerococcus sp. AGMB00486]|uniref:Pyridoxal phosphate homeostasis protein n=2 Tax=Anaerococcus TaxID=165779 RepID=A0ABX2N7G8_9FIRM|nr:MULTISPECIES: YggS family pyridoxal phosphate-dependent enzyme [Anaerococcus]MSS76885.1 YggS family pyridoxal phosphate-dependent enzyme [Anaerococcus porci]NVF10631.1 YggS family pyridoxal phosphate-dependent enzyme [Anaerococcus faecalis]
MTIKDNIKSIENDLKNYDAMLLAVSKTHGIEKIKEAYDCGLRDFGENKVQELIGKIELLNKDINWHLIGHLQSNKVNKIVGKVKLIHSIDSLKILDKVNSRAKNLGIVQDCLIQVNVSREATKFGIYIEEIENFINEAKNLDFIHIKGLMTIAPDTENKELIRSCFRQLKKTFDKLSNLSYNNIDMIYLSMGMTNDYKIALEEGSNIVRIGSKIFGKRMYNNV